jgi:PCFT/HCP family folate transporter-like MFS transporter 1/3
MRQNYPNSSHVSTGSQSACEKNTNTTAYQEQIVVQKLTSEWNIHCNLVTYNIIGIVITLNLATYSDVYGRKLLFIPPIVGSILKNTLCSVGIYFNLNIEWFILFYAIEGCTGSWISLLSMAYSFIADLTEAGKPRSFIIGLLEGGMGIGTFLATILSGYLIKWTGGFFYPEVTSVILVGIELLIIMLILSETLHGSKKRNEVSFCQNMARVTECYKSNFSPLTKRWVFVVLIFIFMMSAFSNIGRISVETLYQLNAPFCWDSIRIGWYGAIRMTMLAFGGLAMIKVFHLFTTDEYIALAGCITTVLSLTIMGLANTNTMLYIGKL